MSGVKRGVLIGSVGAIGLGLFMLYSGVLQPEGMGGTAGEKRTPPVDVGFTLIRARGTFEEKAFETPPPGWGIPAEADEKGLIERLKSLQPKGEFTREPVGKDIFVRREGVLQVSSDAVVGRIYGHVKTRQNKQLFSYEKTISGGRPGGMHLVGTHRLGPNEGWLLFASTNMPSAGSMGGRSFP
jgi:hypothetical protein